MHTFSHISEQLVFLICDTYFTLAPVILDDMESFQRLMQLKKKEWPYIYDLYSIAWILRNKNRII